MKTLIVSNATRGTGIATRVRVADHFWSRLRGLLGRSMTAGEGLLIVPCRAVHTFGMRYDLDIAFLDRDDRVIAVRPSMPPNRATGVQRAAHAVLELPAGTLAHTGTVAGDRLSLERTRN